ncbi:COQ9-domain-containing protein [Xylogone sp. PMI_703]|nr:COQ9-domain-containing protein [Xylogone sp. PMI_703]
MASRSRLLRLSSLRCSASSWTSNPALVTRLYHSYDHPPPPGPFSPTETTILSAALPYVPTHGFTLTSLSLGAKDAGYIDSSINLFPKGAFSLVHYHLVTQRNALSKNADILEISAPGQKLLGIGAKVRALAWRRLMGNKEVIHRWQEALALMSQFSNIPTATAELSSLADEIWFLAGDTSVDSSWYTKRASLSAIYAATELYMTTDKSAGFKDTSEFLDRRLEDAQALGAVAGGLGRWLEFTAHAGVNVLRSKGMRI